MRHARRTSLGRLLPFLCALGACVSSGRLAPDLTPACLASVDTARVRWIHTTSKGERQRSMAWCAGVGPPTIAGYARTDESPQPIVTVVTWNTHVGAGDVRGLVADLRGGRLTAGRRVTAFVLLLQEVRRRDDRIPSPLPSGAKSARAIGHDPRGDRGDDIDALARDLELNLFYAPSMRNGSGRIEDRGNAILSSLPLDGYTAIELPLERQRRVAVEAMVRLPSPGGRTATFQVASVHLTNAVGHHAWVLSEAGRTRQARALARAIDGQTVVVGGDFNTWFDAWDAAYREMGRHARAGDGGDRRPTFAFMRLDHFFYRTPDTWRFDSHRAAQRYGSDHYPLIGELRLPL